MLKNKNLFKHYELDSPNSIMPTGLTNNRVYDNLEIELKKPVSQDLKSNHLIKIIKVYCVPKHSGGLLWQPEIWNVLNGQSYIDPEFLPPEKNKMLYTTDDGQTDILNHYEHMLYECGHFKMKWTEAVCIIFNDGQEIHEFFYKQEPYNEEARKKLCLTFRDILIRQEKINLENLIQSTVTVPKKVQPYTFKI